VSLLLLSSSPYNRLPASVSCCGKTCTSVVVAGDGRSSTNFRSIHYRIIQLIVAANRRMIQIDYKDRTIYQRKERIYSEPQNNNRISEQPSH
jgi:hypothetical protein